MNRTTCYLACSNDDGEPGPAFITTDLEDWLAWWSANKQPWFIPYEVRGAWAALLDYDTGRRTPCVAGTEEFERAILGVEAVVEGKTPPPLWGFRCHPSAYPTPEYVAEVETDGLLLRAKIQVRNHDLEVRLFARGIGGLSATTVQVEYAIPWNHALPCIQVEAWNRLELLWQQAEGLGVLAEKGGMG